VETQQESGMIKGKVMFKESLQRFSYKKGKMYIQNEEMAYDILHNQLIKATLHHLMKQEHIEQRYRDEIRKVLTYFKGITLIKVNSAHFTAIHLHRNNQHYRFLLNICQFIWMNTFLHEGDGEKGFLDFSRNHQKLAKLFENFVKRFYQKELLGSKVRGETLYWPADGEHTDFLPVMRTDISIEYHHQKVIMDTKFYQDLFGVRWNKETVQSGHLYQLFSYLKNDEYYRGKKARGILLYPKVHKAVDFKYRLHGFHVQVCTVDLTQHWETIHKRLLGIVLDW
jgi:5-methylcytosine-specific restriction enzyme subunit McrC